MSKTTITTPFLRTPYNYDRDAASNESGLTCHDKTLTKQSFKEECDINTIVRRFGITGELPGNTVLPTYGDFIGVADYRSAMDAIAKANEAFDGLPSAVRYRFNNDPARFVDFCSNEENRQELAAMGLLKPEEAPAGGG